METLKNFRWVNKLTQAELAEYLGLGQSFLSQIESGDRPLPQEKLDKLLSHPEWDLTPLTNPMKKEEKKEKSNESGEIALLKEELKFVKSQNEKLWKLIDKLSEK